MGITITILYDNETALPGLGADWGFACLIEGPDGGRILFDTGADGSLLLENMAQLGIAPESIAEVFLSHPHWDHTGGLRAFLARQPAATVFLPPAGVPAFQGMRYVAISGPCLMAPWWGSTGELPPGEQALVLDTGQGWAVVTGCAHPGVGEILRIASGFGPLTALVGGLHDFQEFAELKNLKAICPCHCTRHGREIRERYPAAYLPGGVGRILKF